MPVVKRYETGLSSVFEIYFYSSTLHICNISEVMKNHTLQHTLFDLFLVKAYYPQSKELNLILSQSESSQEDLVKSYNKRFNFDEAHTIFFLILGAVS